MLLNRMRHTHTLGGVHVKAIHLKLLFLQYRTEDLSTPKGLVCQERPKHEPLLDAKAQPRRYQEAKSPTRELKLKLKSLVLDESIVTSSRCGPPSVVDGLQHGLI